MIEAASTSKLETDYQYNALDDLTSVTQWGGASGSSGARVRSFSYDSLSRLIQAFNPEAGTLTYSYLSNGNLCAGDVTLPCSKTDARGVTTNYAYDALNRLVSKSYSDGATPISCYQYDTSSISGAGGNLIGRLTNAWTQKVNTACSSSGPQTGSYLSLKSILAYDTMGRETNAQQQYCVSGQCSAPTPYSLSMNYDLAGNMRGLTNSVGANLQPLTLTTAFDATSRPCLMSSSTTNASWNYFPATLFQANSGTGSSAGYTAAGALQNWYMGASTATPSSGCGQVQSSPINIQQGYTNRLWVNSVTASGQIP